MSSPSEHTTHLIREVGRGTPGAAEALLPLVYDQLRAMAESYFRHQDGAHTLQPTALVHEAFIKLAGGRTPEYQDRRHFCAVAAMAMRQILVDHARARQAHRRGGDRRRVTLPDASAPTGPSTVDLLALDEALRQLALIDPRQARVVELRFFAGLSVHEAAEVLGVSDRTIELDWRMAKAWLSRNLSEPED